MAGGERRTEQVKSNLDNLIEQGFAVAKGLMNEAILLHSKGETTPGAESAVIKYNKFQILELTADRIEEALSILRQRLSGFRTDPSPELTPSDASIDTPTAPGSESLP
ncbi:hypothetical protein A2V56_03680 [Candidatus Woesebacteria bacterium RBG_19FT_COMBO_42_9]|uniref:Uncharacterized protein n=1 Tax=Candidatus Woesebacteria bacterium RBG_16_42_24 TaxID=1802485 RepID=A0A1F7XKN1_9BACT|nr:MAG: hypothetical protein A2V97_01670 [Candidatus Woesebacteria bacterium RBG_16_42_24]OGM16846.1 MAG: hypothetical protein A2V56_03680 [Candidatus Woesebacteria bacterium RBG_19FT_COMBO_42_9]OGM67599.1 MAG: hypothetical protein A2985_00325 [Candidatus Woesebacteria bacterium RIFCSPLOWO2_01_FULL_43_11]